METVANVLFSYLNIGTTTRLCSTSKDMHLHLHNETFHASLKYGNVHLKSNYTIDKLKKSSRCRECGTSRRITKYKRHDICRICRESIEVGCHCEGLKLMDYKVCMTCVRDETNFRFLLLRDEAYSYALRLSQRNNQFILKKSTFLKKLSCIKPIMITRKKAYLFSPRDVIALAFTTQ